VGIFARFRKRRAIGRYLSDCPALLRARYGVEKDYSPARVVATLEASRLSLEFVEYACVMFATNDDFVAWARKVASERTFVKPSGAELFDRYDSLRAEVADDYNDGNRDFLPEPGDPFDRMGRGPDGVAHSRIDFRWYR